MPTTRFLNPRVHQTRAQRGSVALEYVLVTGFALIVSTAALSYVHKVIRAHLETLGDRAGVSPPEELEDPFATGRGD